MFYLLSLVEVAINCNVVYMEMSSRILSIDENDENTYINLINPFAMMKSLIDQKFIRCSLHVFIECTDFSILLLLKRETYFIVYIHETTFYIPVTT